MVRVKLQMFDSVVVVDNVDGEEVRHVILSESAEGRATVNIRDGVGWVKYRVSSFPVPCPPCPPCIH